MNILVLANAGSPAVRQVPAPPLRPMADEPIHSAARLPCAACGRTLHDHDGLPPDCSGFVRPALATGYAYASSLGAGTTFQFLGRSTGRAFVTHQETRILDDENGLVEVRTDATTYLVEGTTIVRLAPTGRPAEPSTEVDPQDRQHSTPRSQKWVIRGRHGRACLAGAQ
jgi:hypothetical protein